MPASTQLLVGVLHPPNVVITEAESFITRLEPYEVQVQGAVPLFRDDRNGAYYIVCHAQGERIAQSADLDAVMDPEDEEYRLNRELYIDSAAFLQMKNDAGKGRPFEDIVVQYDLSYRPDKPLKVIGGQHRVKAIVEVRRDKGTIYHGLRVYFQLSDEQKVDIATINNTSIAVAPDLLDRMQEELLGKELRGWCQKVGILNDKQQFADKRSAGGVPTVRAARTFVVNYQMGRQTKLPTTALHLPYICGTGAKVDTKYRAVRSQLNWSDTSFLDAGKEWARLHALQQQRARAGAQTAKAEYANKSMHLTVVAAWAYAAGVFQHHPALLKNHYALGQAKSGDPLNALALTKARLPGTDPDNYRGLGARIGPGELGRMFEVFNLQAETGKGINDKIAILAIKTYVAKQKNYEVMKDREKL